MIISTRRSRISSESMVGKVRRLSDGEGPEAFEPGFVRSAANF